MVRGRKPFASTDVGQQASRQTQEFESILLTLAWAAAGIVQATAPAIAARRLLIEQPPPRRSASTVEASNSTRAGLSDRNRIIFFALDRVECLLVRYSSPTHTHTCDYSRTE